MRHCGKQTMVYENRPYIGSAASIVGAKEGKGPLAGDFDVVLEDDLLGKDTWEQAESEMTRRTVLLCLEKAGLTKGALDGLFCGDLLNQIAASGFSARELGTPFFGLYGACSTMIEGMLLASAMVDAGFMTNAVCAASSHFCAAERQFRFPLELGNQRPPSAQWTATACGAALLTRKTKRKIARVECGTIGRVVDYAIKDANHMGAAMAPAVADTLTAHFEDMGRGAADYSLVVTGDLGCVGRDILLELMARRGLPVPEEKLLDCGALLYYREQDTHAGGSGCGCIASVLTGHFLKLLESGEAQRILAVGSGAMLSPTTQQQGESIPGIAYAASLEGVRD